MSAASGSQLVITCLVCEEKIQTWRGDIRVVCRCGAEYHARTGRLVEDPICGLLSADFGQATPPSMTQVRRQVPSAERIASHWSLRVDECWACGLRRRVQRAHIVAHQLAGSDSDPANYVLLCRTCHENAPSVADPAVMWEWIEAESSLWLETMVVSLARELMASDSESWAPKDPEATKALVAEAMKVISKQVGDHQGHLSRATYSWAVPQIVKVAKQIAQGQQRPPAAEPL